MSEEAGTGMAPARLRRPQLPPGTLSRARLLDRLRTSTHRLVLVTGPAGFGKSVLVAQWLESLRAPVAWLSVDELDNDPKRFINHLADALQALSGAAAGAAADSPASAAADAAASAAADALRHLRAGADLRRDAPLVAHLERVSPAATLVLDDVHLLEDPAATALLGQLVELQAGPRLVLLSRIMPPVPLARLRAGGALLELREQDLRFTHDEAVALFEALLPGGLESELVRRLDSRTEGWAAGLRMAALVLESADDRRAAVEAFTGSHQFVADYLVEEAIGRLPAALQQFLMDTSVLGRFTAATCAAVTAAADADALLESVSAANLFLVPLGADRTWFRYHHLFAELLQFRLRRLQPGREDVLHERASRWFEEHGEIAAALEHAARMSDSGRLAGLLDRYALLFLARSEMVSLKRWLRLVPDPARADWPTLLLAVGWLRALAERDPDLEPLFAAGRAALGAPPDGYTPGMIASGRAEFEILRAYHARFTGRYRESLAIGDDLLKTVTTDDPALRGRALFNQGRTLMMLGDMPGAYSLLEESIRQNLRGGTHYLVLTGLAQSAAVLLELEGAVRARQSLEAALRLATERQLTRMPAFSAVMWVLGLVHVTAGDLEPAEPCFASAVDLGRMGDMPDGVANGLAGLARIRALQGRFDEAHELLLEVEAMGLDRNTGLADGDVAIPRLRHDLLRAAAGHDAPLPAHTAEEHEAPECTVPALNLALYRMLHALRRPETQGYALQTARQVRLECGSRGLHVAATVAAAVEALLCEGEERWPLLDASLAAAGRRRYVTPLLELGAPLRPLLQAALGRPLSRAARAHARLLLQRAGDAGATADAGGASLATDRDRYVAAASLLTDREQAVLERLVRGLSNKAIARSMFVSPETVKTHLKHIFDKLNVTRRRDAVARARELGLAPDAADLP